MDKITYVIVIHFQLILISTIVLRRSINVYSELIIKNSSFNRFRE